MYILEFNGYILNITSKGGFIMSDESKYIKWLNIQTNMWVQIGLISEEQEINIQTFYKENPNYPKKQDLLPTILSVIGSILVGLGIILLVAKNWEILSRPTRLIISILPFLAGFSVALWLISKNSPRAYLQSVGIFISISILAGLGLVGQTYHVVSPAQNLYLATAILSLPFIYLIGSTISSIFYVILICIYTAMVPKTSHDIMFFESIFLVALIIPYLIYMKNKLSSFEAEWLKGFIALSGLVIIFATSSSEIFIFEKVMLYAMLLLIANDMNLYSAPFLRNIGVFLLFLVFFLFTFDFKWESMNFAFNLDQWIILVFMLLLTSVLIYKLYHEHKSETYLSFIIIPLLGIIYNFTPYSDLLKNMFLWGFNLSFFVISIFIFFTGYKKMVQENSGIIKANMGLLMILIIISKWFFDINVSFFIRGIMFIILGASFLIFNFVFSRQKRGNVHEK